jgi:hypothetical protein
VWEHGSAIDAADRIEAEWQHRISLLRPRSATAAADGGDDEDEDDPDEDEGDIVHSGDEY